MELEYSLAFRLLIYRIDAGNSGNQTNVSQRAQCIGKFHRNVCCSNGALLLREETFRIE